MAYEEMTPGREETPPLGRPGAFLGSHGNLYRRVPTIHRPPRQVPGRWDKWTTGK